MSTKSHNAPSVPFIKQVDQFFRSTAPLKNAGVIKPGGPKETRAVVSAIRRYGMSIASLLEQQCARDPERLALVDDSGELTYEELRHQARALARSFAQHGVAPGGTVAVLARNGRALMLPLAACAYVGAHIMLLNPGSSANQVRGILSENDARVLIRDTEFSKGLEDVPGVIQVSGFEEEGDAAPSLRDWVAGGEVWDGVVYEPLPHKVRQRETIIMSSGTFGIPKGVILPVPRTPKVLGGVLERIPWRRGMVVQQTASMFHAWGWLNAQIALATGSTLVFRRYFDAEQAVDDLVNYGVTGIVSAAVFLRDLVAELDRRHVALKPMRFVASSGNAIPPVLVHQLIDRFGPVLCNFYGSTEHGQIAIATGQDLAADPLTCGRAPMGVSLAVLDENGKRVPNGTVGRVFSSNSMTMTGFVNDRDKFVTVDGMLFTGDLGYLAEDGQLFIKGRADGMVIKGGENVYPNEVQDLLTTLPGVADVYVVGRQDDVVAKIDAYVVVEDNESGRALNAESVKSLVREKLAEHNVPDNVIFVEELPRNEAGKVVPRHLPKP